MDLAAAPWRASYPAGLSPDATLAGFPVHGIVDEAAGQWPDRTAAVFRGVTMTFAELALQVDRAGRAFQAAGVRSGTRVALLLPNSIHHLVAFFGVLKAGATVVHLSPLDGRERSRASPWRSRMRGSGSFSSPSAKTPVSAR